MASLLHFIHRRILQDTGTIFYVAVTAIISSNALTLPSTTLVFFSPHQASTRTPDVPRGILVGEGYYEKMTLI